MRTLNPSNQVENLQAHPIANVRFRVRCETLGHGEEVYWQQHGDSGMQKVRTLTREIGGKRIALVLGVTCHAGWA